MSFSSCKKGSGFAESNKIITLLKGVHMTFLKSVRSAVVLAGVAGVLVFGGGTFAQAHDLGFVSNGTVITNGVTAQGMVTAVGGVPGTPSSANANEVVKVTVTLSGVPTKSGTQVIGVETAKGGTVTPPATSTAKVTGGTALTGPATFDFTFNMPNEDVKDIKITNTWYWGEKCAEIISTDALFAECWTEMATDLAKGSGADPNNPLVAFMAYITDAQWTTEAVFEATKEAEAKAAAKALAESKLDEGKEWWVSGAGKATINLSSGYADAIAFVVEETGWNKMVDGTSSDKDGKPGHWSFAIKLKTGNDLTALAGAIGSVATKAKKFSTGEPEAGTIHISRQPNTAGDGTPTITAGGFVQYETNITARLNITASVADAPAGFDQTSLQYTWYATTLAGSTAEKVYTGTGKNAWMVKSTATAANGGNVFVLPEGLTSKRATGHVFEDSVYYYFATVAAPSSANIDMATSNSVIVTVKARPSVTITTQASDLTGTNAITFPADPASNKLTVIVESDPADGITTGASNGGKVQFRWFWTSKTGSGGAPLTDLADIGTGGKAEYGILANTRPGTYYYRCEISFPNAITIMSQVVTVEVKPTAAQAGLAAGTSVSLLTSAATINVPDITTLDYAVPTPRKNTNNANNNTGTKLRVTIPPSGIVTGGPSGQTFSIDSVIYTKVLPKTNANHNAVFNINTTDNATPTGDNVNYNHGVDNAGTYEVLVRARNADKTVIGYKKVLLVVKPKALSTITNANFVVKAPANDTIYNGKKKTPSVEIKDGTYTLVAGTDYKVNDPVDPRTWVNAGSAGVVITGCADIPAPATGAADLRCTANSVSDANYTGDRAGSFTIRRMPISINAVTSTVAAKDYDGTDTVSSTGIDVKFNPATLPEALERNVDFFISGAKFDNKDVGTRTVSSIGIRLDDANSPIARNYTFGAVNAAPVLTSTFSKTGVAINKAAVSPSFLKYNVPTTHLFNNQGRGIGSVEWKAGVTNPGQSAFEVFYTATSGSPTKELPKGDVEGFGETPVSYAVSVAVNGGSNFLNGTIYISEPYTINPRGRLDDHDTRPLLKSDEEQDTTVYVGMPLALKVSPVRPDSATWTVKDANGEDSTVKAKFKGGNVSYQWYKLPTAEEADMKKWDTLKVRGGTTDTYTLPQPLKEGTEWYQVRVIWTYPAVTVADTTFITVDGDLNPIRVKIGPEPVSIQDADVKVDGQYTYDGTRITIVPANVSVTIGDKDLKNETDYTFTSYGLGAGKGAGTVTVTGKNAYKGTVIGYFDIDKITTTEDILTFGTTKQYNDSIQEFTVAPRGGLTGLGVVTRVYKKAIPGEDGEDGGYETLSGAPKAVGSYVVSVSIAEGANFTAMDEFTRPFNIVKRVLTKTDFTYSIPPEHAYTGVAKPAVTATLKSTVKGYTGTYSVVYLLGNSQLTAMPTAEGSYEVAVNVTGDANFANAMVILGDYVIHEAGWVGVKGSDREVPKSDVTNVSAVAPVKVVASGFTAGPSPVKAGSAIKFFSAKTVKSGTLYIFDANGNSVAKVSAKSASGEIGSWNLKDKKGASVSEGTYVVKGALLGKDGSKEKVSFPFSVVK